MAKMRKEIKKYGDALVFRFNKDEKLIHKIELGKVYDLEMTEVLKNE